MAADDDPTPSSVRLEERKRRVAALLASRDDYLPSPRSSLPDADHKPSLSARVPCGVCHGRGRVVKRKQLVLCIACDGTGQRRRRTGDPAYDMNLEPGQRRLAEGRAHAMSPREAEEEISRLEADANARRGIERGYGWERARTARDRNGSYPELDAALAALAARRPELQPSSDEGLALLASLMGERIRVPVSHERELAEERRRVAVDLHRRGWSAGEIGRALGLGRLKVGRLLKPARPV